MVDTPKMRQCLNCSKDTRIGEPCEHCAFDYEAAEREVRAGILREKIRAQILEDEKKKTRKSGWG